VLTRLLQDMGEDIRLDGEAFYYFAWRAHDALEAIGVTFSADGVRDLRNRMIEHPNGKGGVLVSWWMVDCPEGLVLMPDGKGLDKGLYPNARQFITNLLASLERNGLATDHTVGVAQESVVPRRAALTGHL
jgi:hypothetical protein